MTVLRVSVLPLSKLRVSMVLAISSLAFACGGPDDPGPDSGPGPVDARVADAPTPPVDAPMTDTGTTPGRTCPFAGGACDVLGQDCTGTEGCYYVRTSASEPASTMCVPSGTGGDGDDCTTVDDCQPGFTCGNDDKCRHYCCMHMASDCTSGQICIGISGAGDIGVCNAIDNCTLAPQGGCDAGEGCQIVAEDGSTSCFMAGTAAEGAACATIDACQAGFGCYGIGGEPAACHEFCRIGMTGECSSGRECTELGAGFPTGIGLCITPDA